MNITNRILAIILSTVLCLSLFSGCKQNEFDISNSEYDLSAALEAEAMKELSKNYFRFGIGLTGNAIATAAVNSPEYMAVVEHHFNSVTLTNLMKPTFLLDEDGCRENAKNGSETEVAVKFDSVDKTLQWCKDNGVQMRGHTLIWHAQTPDWFFKVGYKSSGDYVDYDTMNARMESYIKGVLEYVQKEYPGVIYCWDVVNEAVEPAAYDPDSPFGIRTKHGDGMTQDNLWYKTLGVDYVELAFTYARKYADPEVKLFYNDFNTFQSKKRDFIYALADDLKSKGLIDGIGMQAYWTGGWFSPDDVEFAINKFGSLGLEIHITELSLHTDGNQLDDFNLKKQADNYKMYFEMFQRCDTDGGGNANITAVTIFGLMDGFVFYDNDSTSYALLDTNFQPKPNFYAIQDVLKELCQ